MPTLFRGAVALTIASFLVVAAAPPAGADDGDAPRIEGSWFVTIPQADPGRPPMRAVATYGAGGAFTTMLSVPPAGQSIFSGTWARTGPRRFSWTALSFVFDDTGAFTGIVLVRETVTIEPGGNSYAGRGSVDLLDTAGNFLMHLFEAPVQATRIRGR